MCRRAAFCLALLDWDVPSKMFSLVVVCGSFILSYFNFFIFLLQPLMDQYFERIQQLLGRSDFPVRIRFMIEDVIDLRNAKVTRNACYTEVHNINDTCSITANRHLLLVDNNSI